MNPNLAIKILLSISIVLLIIFFMFFTYKKLFVLNLIEDEEFIQLEIDMENMKEKTTEIEAEIEKELSREEKELEMHKKMQELSIERVNTEREKMLEEDLKDDGKIKRNTRERILEMTNNNEK